MKPFTCTDFNALLNGCVVKYRNKFYWLSNGLDGRIITDANGFWQFVDCLKWKSFTVVYAPEFSYSGEGITRRKNYE